MHARTRFSVRTWHLPSTSSSNNLSHTTASKTLTTLKRSTTSTIWFSCWPTNPNKFSLHTSSTLLSTRTGTWKASKLCSSVSLKLLMSLGSICWLLLSMHKSRIKIFSLHLASKRLTPSSATRRRQLIKMILPTQFQPMKLTSHSSKKILRSIALKESNTSASLSSTPGPTTSTKLILSIS